MAREAWQELVRRFCPPDKRICNCGDAYYTLIPASHQMCLTAEGYVDHWACEYGCSAAQITARDIVAKAILAIRPPWMCRLGLTCQHPEAPRTASGECTGCLALNGPERQS